MIYYVLAFLIFLFSLYDISIERNIAKSNVMAGHSVYTAFIAIFFIMGGIRWVTGTDWPPYYKYFTENVTWNDYNSGAFEIGYAFLNFAVRCFSSSYTAFLCVFSFLVISIKYGILRELAYYPALTLFLAYCSNIGDILAVRQSLASSILLFSIYYIHKKDKIKFFLLLVIATAIHNASIFWIFAYYIYHKQFKTYFIAIVFITAFIVGLNGMNIFIPLSINFFERLSITGRAISKILVYLNSTDTMDYSLFKIVVSIIKRVLFIPFFLLIRNRMCRIDPHIHGLLNLYFFGNVIYLLFSTSIMYFQRLTGSYIITEIFLLPVLLKVIKKQAMKYIWLLAILVYGVLKLYTAISTYSEVIIPYYTIFNYGKRIMR